jgi:hypothetical protein
MTFANAAAWLSEAKTHPSKIKESTVGKLEANEILICNYTLPINPINGLIQT